MNGAASAGAQRMSLERSAVPDEAGLGTAASAARAAVTAVDATGQFLALFPPAHSATDALPAATNAWRSAVRVVDFPLSSLSRGPPDDRF